MHISPEEEAALRKQLEDALREAGEEGMDDAPPLEGPLADLLRAAEAGDLGALKAVLDSAPDVGASSSGEDGDSPLHLASLYGHLSCVEELLRRGADPTAIDDDGSTPLHDASASGHATIVAALLATGRADVGTRDSDLDTPLHLACNGSHATVAKLLLEHVHQRGGGADAVRALLAERNAASATPLELCEDDGVRAVIQAAATG